MTSPSGSRFVFTRIDALPPLAWCAELHRGESEVAVRHGPLVETGSEGFFEGVWDGPFSEFGFRSACTTMGSGGCWDEDGIHFVAPSHTYESLTSLMIGERLWVSNSIAFVLAAAGDEPDLRYPAYHRDLLALQRRGITAGEPASLPTARGRSLLLHAATDLVVDRQLTVSTRARPRLSPPGDFAAYRAQLARSIAVLVGNARDPKRRFKLPCATTISAGYDSTAITVLAAEAGLRDAIVFESERNSADSGRVTAETLGMTVHKIDPAGWRRLPGCLEPEFLAGSSGWAMFPMAGLAEGWRNAVIFLGSMGDDLWRCDRQDVLDTLARPRELQPCYAGLREFRLRAGIIFVHAPTIGAASASAIHRITQSDEMKPWAIGGKYDRPIPRRIVESAGIARRAFGQTIYMTIDTQTPEILARLKQSSFGSFIGTKARVLPWPMRWQLLLEWRWGTMLARHLLTAARLVHGAGRRLRLRPLDRIGKSAVITLVRWQWHGPMPILYTFHWAMAQLIGRYRDANG